MQYEEDEFLLLDLIFFVVFFFKLCFSADANMCKGRHSTLRGSQAGGLRSLSPSVFFFRALRTHLARFQHTWLGPERDLPLLPQRGLCAYLHMLHSLVDWGVVVP